MPRPLDAFCSTLAFWLRGGLAAALVVGAQAASAVSEQPLDIELSYLINTPYQITNVITFNSYADNGIGAWWTGAVNPPDNLISDPFAKSSANAPLTALMLGLTGQLPEDPQAQTHVVMMVNADAEGSIDGNSFGALFPNTNEATLASQIQFVTGVTRDPDGTGNSAVWDAALNGLFTFAQGDALQVPGSPSPYSIWFNLGAVVPGATTSTDFSVVAFSNGQVLGSGQANLTTLATAVPEAPTWAMLMLGLGVLGAAARRRAY